DIEGRKMSKSLGNIIDPLEIIEHVGADALRFSLVLITAAGQDVYLSEEKFKTGRNFANKIWNASRFVLINLEPKIIPADPDAFLQKEKLNLINRWILSRFYSVLEKVNKALDNFRFNETANLLYSFFWHEFCDWYLEWIKPQAKVPQNQIVMYRVLEGFLRILHPFMPFITEEIWQKMNSLGEKLTSLQKSIMIQDWPPLKKEFIEKRIESNMKTIFEIVRTLRNIRTELSIPMDLKLEVSLSPLSSFSRRFLEETQTCIENLAKANIKIQPKPRYLNAKISRIIKDIWVTVPLEGVVDLKKEKERIETQIQELRKLIKSKQEILNNKEFLRKAPSEIVESERKKLKELEETLKQLKQLKDELFF
ncbi:MAG: class I tRNA ligase family protein, partial [Candidatus Omnitrophica bacterium]|nr:class I tRNA ligase family protein [Candidatus Omnitrophota bacterium]